MLRTHERERKGSARIAHSAQTFQGKFQFGRVQNCGGISYRSPNTFIAETTTPTNIWYNLRIEVDNNKNVKVFLNNVLKGSFTAYFNTRGFGGVAVANGYSTTCQFRDFEIEPMN